MGNRSEGGKVGVEERRAKRIFRDCGSSICMYGWIERGFCRFLFYTFLSVFQIS